MQRQLATAITILTFYSVPGVSSAEVERENQTEPYMTVQYARADIEYASRQVACLSTFANLTKSFIDLQKSTLTPNRPGIVATMGSLAPNGRNTKIKGLLLSLQYEGRSGTTLPIGVSRASLSPVRAFIDLQAVHQKTVAGLANTVASRVADDNEQIVTAEQLKEATFAVDQTQLAFMSSVEDQAQLDDLATIVVNRSLHEINQIARNLADLKSAATFGYQCTFYDLEDVVTEFTTALDAWASVLTNIRQHIAEAAAKRDQLFYTYFSFKRAILWQAYTEATARSLSDVQQDLQAVLKVDRFGNRFHQWKNQILSGGITGGEHTERLQYHSSLQILAAHRRNLAAFQSEFTTLGSLPEAIDREMRAQIALVSHEIKRVADQIEGQGWTYRYQKQRLLNARRRQLIKQGSRGFGPSCLSAIAAYDVSDSGLNVLQPQPLDQEQFKVLEVAYRQVVAACKSGRE